MEGPMANCLGEHAIVIGGSLAGLMTARVLADHFESVTVLERDLIESGPALHRSIPQGNHLHGLLLGGQQVMASLYPNFLAKLEEFGSVRCAMGKEFVLYGPFGKAYTFTGSVREPHDFGVDFYQQSRGLLEYCVRQFTLDCRNVKFQSECAVRELVCRSGHVEGVCYNRDGESSSLAADLVVDAGGRGSHAPHWLRELGFQSPAETSIRVDLAYASTKFRVPEDCDRRERLIGFDWAIAPDCPSSGLLEIIEGDLWHVTLAGRFGDYPPHDEAGFLAFAKSLRTARLYELIKDAERVADITTYRYPTAVRRHYERLPAFPEGFVVLGDAIASFNPVWGQGMSVAALQVQAFQQLLAERAREGQGLGGLAMSFFQKAAEVAGNAWTLAANLDLSYPQTQGERPPDLKEQLAYFAALDALAPEDAEVHRLLIEVGSLCKPLSALSEEQLRSRALAEQRKHPEKYNF
jgi:2-polyprenyl-6-methoxyphenol hydroxylase-like FAD-dependent oxidoreductase